jgi:hypothetical protein
MRGRDEGLPESALVMAGMSRCASRTLLAAAVLAAPLASHAQQRGSPLRIHVRGSAQIDAVAWSERDGFVVRGSVIDDARSPVARAAISIQGVSLGGARAALPSADSCAPRGSAARYPASADGYAVETDESGGFCVRGQAPLAAETSLRIRFQGSKLYEAAEAKVPMEDLQAALSPALLRFDPAVDAIDLDRESVNVTVALRIDRSGSQRPAADVAIPREGLTIALEDERGTKLGEAPTGGDGRVRFELKTASLDGPGEGELRARFDGSALLAKATAGQSVARRAQVTLALSHPIERARADDGVPIDVDVGSSRGPVDSGVVEALRAGESVGTAAVATGKARVLAAFTSEREGSVPITLRYVPSTPWWRPGPELAVSVPVAGPGMWRQIALGALVLAIAGWVLGGWRRAPKTAAAPANDGKTATPAGRAGVRVVGPSDGVAGWRGVVADAHEGTPVAQAELTIVVPVFEGSGVVAHATADKHGAFTLEGAHRSDARLVVRSSTHSSHEQALPPPSTLSIALITRRRSLVDRLVRWARRQGAPFEGPPEPTPGHVRRVATRAQQYDVEAWASLIESAAFGPEPVDERVEQQVSAAEPKPGAPRVTS